MARYRSRQVEVEAFQWQGGPLACFDLGSWMAQRALCDDVPFPASIGFGQDEATISTKSGEARFEPGDYLIVELDGSGYYPCQKEIFEQKYVAVLSVGEAELGVEL